MDIFFYDIKMTKFFAESKTFVTGQSFLAGREREIETIFSMGNGFIGTRNSLEEFYPQSTPGTFIAGFYEREINDEIDTLVKIPDWTRIKIFVEGEQLDLRTVKTLHHHRYIDFGNGTVVRDRRCEDEAGRITSVKITKYISLYNKHETGKSILIKPENYTGNIRILSGIDCDTAGFNYLINQNINLENHAAVYMKSKFSNKEFILLQKSEFASPDTNYERKIINNFSGSYEEFKFIAETGNVYGINGIVCFYAGEESDFSRKSAEEHFSGAKEDFFAASLENHAKTFQSRLKESSINIIGNKHDQNFIDFSLYHLIIAGEFSGCNCSIPARELSGESYKGHVFWDTEMFLIPFYTYTKPEIARHLLMYRYNTLAGAKQNALKENFKGASYAWESTGTGLEDTPEYAVLPNGQVIYILSGQYENHISADIAYAVWKYYEATEDNEFLVNYGAEILFETARFYENLVKLEADGLYHIPSVIGPDEYHEKINDNVYTNYLAMNNFEVALKAYNFLKNNFNSEFLRLKEKIGLDDSEVENWQNYKDNIYTGYDKDTKIFEQFKGFYDLEYIDLKQFEPRTVPLDIILGSEKTQKSQVIKQADVLMLLFLFGERFSKEELIANYEFYEPRTGHGSSLSPSVHSITAARSGKIRKAYNYFQKNVRIDLDDKFGNAAGGIHIASVGGTWMSVVMGFAGMCSCEKGLSFNPNLPESWEKLIFSVNWRNLNLKIEFRNDKMNFSVSSDKENPSGIFVGIGKDNRKEFKTNNNYSAVKINGVWNWR